MQKEIDTRSEGGATRKTNQQNEQKHTPVIMRERVSAQVEGKGVKVFPQAAPVVLRHVCVYRMLPQDGQATGGVSC